MKTRKGIFVVILDKEDNLLLVHRVLNWKGWELPKGGCDGKTEKRTLKEELWEELSLKEKDYTVEKRTNIFLTYKYPPSYVKKWKVSNAKFRGYVIRSKINRISFKNNPEKEHDKYKWVSMKMALKLFTFSNQRLAVNKIIHEYA